jgi:hypothetical protein
MASRRECPHNAPRRIAYLDTHGLCVARRHGAAGRSVVEEEDAALIAA